jgi:hypothetical protein
MRVVVHEYARGGHTAFETTNDGGELLAEWDGQRQVGERICAFVEAACDDSDEGVRRLLEAMTWLMDEIRRRKSSAPSAERAATSTQPTNPAA